MNLSWMDFQQLFSVAMGECGDKNIQEKSIQNLVSKRRHLEEVQSTFLQATDETILSDYHRLRKAHREFLISYREAIVSLSSKPISNSK